MPQPLESALRSLAAKLAGVSWEALPQSARHAAQRIFLDDLGAILAGSTAVELAGMRAAWARPRNSAGATFLAPGFPRGDLLYACLHNGTSGGGPEIAEGYRFATAHAGIYTLPVALAVAERDERTGAATLAAMVAGYEAAACCATGIAQLFLDASRSLHAGRLWNFTPAVKLRADAVGEVLWTLRREGLETLRGKEIAHFCASEYAVSLGIKLRADRRLNTCRCEKAGPAEY